MTPKESVSEVFKSEMEAADSMRDLLTENNEDEIVEATFDQAEELLEKVEDPNRMRVVFATSLQIAEAIGSQELAEFGAKGLERLKDGGD